MKKQFAVTGYPLIHTMSPFINSKLFAISGSCFEYGTLPIEPMQFNLKFENLKSLNGFNVTVPFKETVISYLDELSASAKYFSSVNTVLNKNGRLIGYNTDAFGFEKALNLCNIPIPENALICGCGGVARTISLFLASKGCNITFALRNIYSKRFIRLENELKQRFNTKITAVNVLDAIGSFDLAVNCTPVGMYPDTESSVLTVNQLKNIKNVFDTVYNPTQTKLILNAKSLGINASCGMGMLVMQAVKAHEYWYGGTFKNEDILSLINESYAETERIFK